MEAELFWISGPWGGRLAISSRPRGGDWLEDEARAWRRAGVDVVVSLLEDDEAAQLDLLGERHATEGEAINFVSFPIPDRGVPASTKAAIEVIGRIAAQLVAGKNVAVHCRQGVGRSGMIAAGLLVSSGLHPQSAIETVGSARGISVPETPEQRQWIERLPSHVAVPTETGFESVA
jgi:protein-tyrosine phosphatase